MHYEKLIKRTAAMLAGILVFSGTVSFSGVPMAAGNTEPAGESTAAQGDAAGTDTSPEAEDWYKAELSEYDDSLYLTSYETSPESGEVTDKSGKKGGPTPVELNVTGGYVGDIPWLESEVQIDEIPGKFAVVTYGWGHGVGLSQNGANFYAEYSGWTYQDILFHYYPGTYLMDTGTAEDERITINGVSGDVVTQISRIVYNEIGASMHYEAIKAQAVAVYTYCKYHGGDSADLRGKANPPSIVIDAVREVLGQALYYNDSFALTMFSASSGGITANCYEVFYADLPYLRSVSADYDAVFDPHYGTVTYIDDFQIRNMIQGVYGIKLSDDPSRWIQPSYSEETGYVTTVNIDDQLTVRGYDFKMAMGLKSSKFNVYYTPRPEGEEIPDRASNPTVVDPEHAGTPYYIYPNYNLDGNYYIPPELMEETDPEDEELIEEPAEEQYPDFGEWQEETNWQQPTEYTEPATEPPTEEYTEPQTTEADSSASYESYTTAEAAADTGYYNY
ncbi:MAG: sporulation protein [Ruminococcus sp.]|nr:sporulation protein [Ruminococcus sp.]